VVTHGEREVPQLVEDVANPHLRVKSTGRDKLCLLMDLSKKGKVKVWDYMVDQDLYIMAYESIKGNKGALTPGVTGETLDSFSIDKINKIIRAIKDHTYKFKPIRKVYIPKRNGKLRPLGIPGPEDKVVQKVMAIILEAIYDNENNPVFKDTSHGFRRGRSTHTALKSITK